MIAAPLVRAAMSVSGEEWKQTVHRQALLRRHMTRLCHCTDCIVACIGYRRIGGENSTASKKCIIIAFLDKNILRQFH